MGEIRLKIDALAEALRCIRSSKLMLGRLEQNPSDIQLVLQIGNLYNRFIGTFSFDTTEELFEELVDVSRMVDNLTKLYASEELPSVQENHFEFLKNAIVLIERMMAAHVSHGHLEPTRDEKRQLIECYNSLTDIEEGDRLSQEDVDKLLDML